MFIVLGSLPGTEQMIKTLVDDFGTFDRDYKLADLTCPRKADNTNRNGEETLADHFFIFLGGDDYRKPDAVSRNLSLDLHGLDDLQS